MHLFILIISLFLSVMPLGAKDIEAVGVGKNYEAARQDAFLNLARFVNGESVVVETHTGTTFENGQITNDIYKNASSHYTVTHLIGVEYEQLDNENPMHVKAYISDKSIDTFLNKLASLKKDIDKIYAIKDSRFEIQQNRFNDLLNLLQDYETCIHITKLLGVDETLIPKLRYDITYMSMQFEYQGFLIKYEEEMDDHLKTIKDRNTDEYFKTMDEIDRIRKSQNDLREANERERIDADRRRNARIQDALDSYTRETVSGIMNGKGSTAEQRMDVILEHLNYAKQLIFQRDDMLEREIHAIESERDREVMALRKIPYRTGELFKGKPTDIAVKLRDKQINDLNKFYDSQIEEIRKMINDNMETQIQDCIDEILNLVDDFNNSDLYVSSIDYDGMKVKGQYNTAYTGWNFYISTDLIKNESSKYLFVPYQKITGKAPFDMSQAEISEDFDKDKYDEYLDSIELYDAIIAKNNFNLKMKLHLNFEPETLSCNFNIVSMILEIGDNQIDVSINETVPDIENRNNKKPAKKQQNEVIPEIPTNNFIGLHGAFDVSVGAQMNTIKGLDLNEMVCELTPSLGIGVDFNFDWGTYRTAINTKFKFLIYDDKSSGFDINLNWENGVSIASFNDLYIFLRMVSFTPQFMMEFGVSYDFWHFWKMDTYCGLVMSVGTGAGMESVSVSCLAGIRI